MLSEMESSYKSSRPIMDQCKSYLTYHVILVLDDGSSLDGIIQEVSDSGVHMLVGEDMMVDESKKTMMRQPPGGFNRFRRFRHRNFPFGRINRIGLVPYPIYPLFPPVPYPYPFYPF